MDAPGALTLASVAKHVGGEPEGPADLVLTGVSGIDEAGPGDLTFVANPRYEAALSTTRASAVLLAPEMVCPPGLACIRTSDPYAAMMRVLHLFDPGGPTGEPGVHATALVHPEAKLGANVGIGAYAVVEAGARVGNGTRLGAYTFVGRDATLGENCHLHPRTYVGSRCRLGNRVILYPGAVVGSDGFGYAPVESRYLKIPQIGIVDLGDDVEIGANSCVDRATMGSTRIGRGTKIDNLVMVAHNVAIGEDGVVAAQTGISGSTRIGDRARIGGQVGMIGHLRIGNDVTAGAKSGVIGDIADGETVSGFPARPHREWLRAIAVTRKLPELVRKLRGGEVDEAARKGGAS